MFNLISIFIVFVYRGPCLRMYSIVCEMRGPIRRRPGECDKVRGRDPWLDRHGLLFAGRQLECVNLLQLGDDELAVHIVHLHLKGMDLHIVFLDLVFNVEPFGEGGAGKVVVFLDGSCQAISVHGSEVLDSSNLCRNRFGDTHDDTLVRSVGLEEWQYRGRLVAH